MEMKAQQRYVLATVERMRGRVWLIGRDIVNGCWAVLSAAGLSDIKKT